MNYKGREVPENELKERLVILEDQINAKLAGARSLTINGVNLYGFVFNVKLEPAACLWDMGEGEDIILTVRSGEEAIGDLVFKNYEKLNVFVFHSTKGKDNVTINIETVRKQGR